MDRFEDLKTFVVVAERLSISRAAGQLQVAASAVSRRISDLEARLRTPLLTRTTRRLVLTPAGAAFLARARRILADLDEAEAIASADTRELAGLLRLTAPLSFGLAHLDGVIDGFLQANPALTIDVDFNDRTIDIVAERFDLAIRIGQLADSSLRARHLAPVHHVVAASPAFWSRHGTPAHPRELAGMAALCYSNLTPADRWTWRTPDGADGDVQLRPRYLASNGDALVQAAVAGLGIVRQPTFIADAAIRRGALQPVLLEVDWGVSGLYAIYPDADYLPARTRAFIEHLAAGIGDPPVWDACLRLHRERAGLPHRARGPARGHGGASSGR
ncbi:MAG: LysR family transcriptional regulator [Lautropia sp.]